MWQEVEQGFNASRELGTWCGCRSLVPGGYDCGGTQQSTAFFTTGDSQARYHGSSPACWPPTQLPLAAPCSPALSGPSPVPSHIHIHMQYRKPTHQIAHTAAFGRPRPSTAHTATSSSSSPCRGSCCARPSRRGAVVGWGRCSSSRAASKEIIHAAHTRKPLKLPRCCCSGCCCGGGCGRCWRSSTCPCPGAVEA